METNFSNLVKIYNDLKDICLKYNNSTSYLGYNSIIQNQEQILISIYKNKIDLYKEMMYYINKLDSMFIDNICNSGDFICITILPISGINPIEV